MVAKGSPATRRELPSAKFKRNFVIHLENDAEWIHSQAPRNGVDTKLPAGDSREASADSTDAVATEMQSSLKRARSGEEVGTQLEFIAVNVGVASLARAANILSGIQRRLRDRGWAVGNGEGSFIRIDGEPVELLLSEGTEQIPHAATLEEIRDHQRYLR
jgi:hypothetical protein